jgi:hypothetical protein
MTNNRKRSSTVTTSRKRRRLSKTNDHIINLASQDSNEWENKKADAIFPQLLSAGTGQVTAFEMIPCHLDMPIAQHREFLQKHGYLYLKSTLPRKHVFEARKVIMDDMRKNGFIVNGTESRINDAKQDESPSLLSRQDLAHSKAVLAVTENLKLYDLIAGLLDLEKDSQLSLTSEASRIDIVDKTPRTRNKHANTGSDAKAQAKRSQPPKPSSPHPTILTLPFKWLRAVKSNLCTGPHLDRVYLGNGSQNLLTIWTPLGDIPARQGGLCIAAGSHRRPEFEKLRTEYGMKPAGKDGTKSGWITENPEEIAGMYGIPTNEDCDGSDKGGNMEEKEGGIRWVTADFEAGDIVLFGLDVLHMTVNNSTDCWRLSVETRWQPIKDPYPPFYP